MKANTSHPGWLASFAALVALVLTVSASYWQFARANTKAALRQQYLARQAMPPHNLNITVPRADVVSFRKVRITGTYDPEKAILLDNKVRAGVPGYEIVVPLRLSGTDRYVLINRGWLGLGRNRYDQPAVVVPKGVVTVTGTAIVPGHGALELSDEIVEGRVWQNLDMTRFRDRQGLDIADFVIQEESEQADGINREWPAPGFGIETHQVYAAQWLLFATLIIFFYVYYGFVRRKPNQKQ